MDSGLAGGKLKAMTWLKVIPEVLAEAGEHRVRGERGCSEYIRNVFAMGVCKKHLMCQDGFPFGLSVIEYFALGKMLAF